MTGDGRPADGKGIGDLAHGPAARPQQLDDRPTVGIAKSIEGVARERGHAHGPNRNKNATFSRPGPEYGP